MKMKKVTALLLTVAMAATMLAGCGSKEEKAEGKKEDGKTVLKFAAFEGGNGAEIWKNIENRPHGRSGSVPGRGSAGLSSRPFQ